jgi:hypothetical protein
METEIRIYGEVRGTIWMPTAECTKEFDLILEKIPESESRTYPGISPRSMQIHCLRDALLYITNDGDFQSCAIDWANLEITTRRGHKRITRTYELTGQVDGNKDCFWN